MSPDIHTDIDVGLDGFELLPDGTRLALVALTMTGPSVVDEHSPDPVAPAGMLLRPDQARQLAARLGELADLAEHATTTR